jgi:hypothetical protein
VPTPDSTKIHFSDGQNVVVTQGVRAVVETLGKSPSFVKFTKRNRRTVYISSSQVTYIEQLPGDASRTPKGKAAQGAVAREGQGPQGQPRPQG